MHLRSPYPYWLLRHGIINSYPSLIKDVRTEIVIIGAGISGALVAWYLCQAGFKVVIVDRRHAGMGSTAASTALLQYEIDTPLDELIKKVGEKNAVKSYLLCRKAIDDIEKICNHLNDKSLFARKPSFQFASYKKDVVDLKKEFVLRKKSGISLQWLDEKNVFRKFGFKKPAGLLSEDGAEADAYKITHAILARCMTKGLKVYDKTEITAIHHHKKEIELITADKKKIKAKKLVIACGYESQQYIRQDVQTLHSTYAIASEPFDKKDFWYQNALIWETASPYLYFRTTSDNRIIVGGKDIPYSGAAERDRQLKRKTKDLEKAFRKLFPDLLFKTDFSWSGTFASTKDGLPYIGSIDQRPDTYFALGYGGNGITFSVIAAEILRDMLTGKKNANAEIFAFNR